MVVVGEGLVLVVEGLVMLVWWWRLGMDVVLDLVLPRGLNARSW